MSRIAARWTGQPRRGRAAGGGEPTLDELRAALVEAVPMALLAVDERDDVVAGNRASWDLGLVQDGRLRAPSLLRAVRDARRAGRPLDVEVEAGDGRACRARVLPSGRAGHVLAVVEDLTEPQRVDAMRRDFVANVSHELKTPVGAISLLAEALIEGIDEPAAVRRFAERMVQESRRLARLVQELIELSRLQGAESVARTEAVAVAAAVREAVDRCQLPAQAKGIEIAVGDFDGWLVRGDAGQLATAVANLLDNAIAYSPPGSRVAVGGRRAGGSVEVSVADQGIGIAAADLERIFERFYRADPARSRHTGGTGLGLAIVKHVAANHGGSVGVWSAEGSGSTFTLRLPAAGPA